VKKSRFLDFSMRDFFRSNVRGRKMDKSLLVKLVWLGAIAAIPVAVISLQKPQAVVPAESKRVITVDKPVAVDIKENEVHGPAPLDPMKPLEPAPKPQTMWVGGGKIKGATPAAPAATPAPAKADSPQTTAKDDRSAIPPKDPTKITASVATGAGPRAQ
jgi:hypothetical protein